jgi:hypothetical protein
VISVILLIPLVDTFTSSVFGQGLLQQSIGMDPTCPISVPFNNPTDLSGSVQQLCGMAAPLSIPPPELQQPISSVLPEGQIIPDPMLTFNGLNDPLLGPLQDPTTAISQAMTPQLSLTSPISAFDSSSGASSTIYACMDITSGNIPVNSIRPSPESGCPFQTVPIVIIIDDTSNIVSTCFVASDLIAPTDNCITSSSSLQQQQAIAPPILPFQ